MGFLGVIAEEGIGVAEFLAWVLLVGGFVFGVLWYVFGRKTKKEGDK